ncbi:CAMKK/CAMKK-META protein kinase [Cryptococcus wingfieldii CBS 7118]|uniref:CAMKK/CAMKK-META protein kinase n=1 Tax=Cryptococcus wingfieldii CBS 7118 TaxID=1295528 RepID=A0A1E3IEN7_9TREE|nr:CAMKK/CAMKK-META protein kinase [Cryptococcus wingfieldii CBS 7118]ODN87084.1 CAMKK/CAMKK-META protein kinase [Cryptococcus wingfieldii CBS 7118]
MGAPSLQPPATVVSPPSPTAHRLPHSPRPRPRPPTTDSPERLEAPVDPSPAPPVSQSPPSLDLHHPSPSIESPAPSPSLLRPASPIFASHGVLRSPSPSSPSFRPRVAHHRRASSTHRVRETIDGTQTASKDGERMINQYRIGTCIGQGAYAKVELATDINTGIEYAIKEFSKSRLHHQSVQEKHRTTARSRRPLRGPRRGLQRGPVPDDNDEPSVFEMHKEEAPAESASDPLGLIRREVAVMKKIDHPNLVHLYEAISVPTADALFLVLEYMPGGTLMKIQIGQDDATTHPPFDVWQTREYFRQLCLGLEYLHANDVVHRDIKPDNVLLSADRQFVKLCDFGVSEMFTRHGDDRIGKSGGSPAFQSPENYTASPDLHGRAVDIWALGATLYCMLTGTLPFNYPNVIELYAAVMERDPRIPDDWEDSLQDLVRRLLCKDPEQRIVMDDIRNHPWTTDGGTEPMISTDENLYDVGKHVEAPTEEEVSHAIGTFRGVLLRRLHLTRTTSQSISSPSNSTDPSLASGSMDSYASRDPLTTNTSLSSDPEDGEFGDIAGDQVMSPRQMSLVSPAETEKQTPWKFKLNDLKKLNTDAIDLEGVGAGQEGAGAVMVDSPTSENEDAQTARVGSGSSQMPLE